MKKYFLAIIFVGITTPSWAVHQLIFRDASALTTGTVSSGLLDVGSVTLRGNLWPSQVDTSTTTIANTPATLAAYSNGVIAGGAVSTLDVGNGISVVVNGSTATLSGSSGGSGSKLATVVVGTTAAYGAQVVGTTIDAFNCAVASLSIGGVFGNASSGTIFIQKGEYYAGVAWSSIPANVRLVFEEGATIKWDQTKKWNRIFGVVTGTIDNLQMDITTSSIDDNSALPLIDMRGGTINGAKINIRLRDLVQVGAGHGEVIYLGPNARGSSIYNLTVSTFCADIKIGGSTSRKFMTIDRATDVYVRLGNTLMFDQPVSPETNNNIFRILGGDSVIIDATGSTLFSNERIIIWSNSAGITRNVKWLGGTVRHRANAISTGYISINTGGNIISSGNAIIGLTVDNQVAQTQPTISLRGDGGGAVEGMVFNGVTVNNVTGSTNNTFDIVAGISNIWINSVVSGSSGACFADAGTGTKFTTNDNFCNGVEQ